MGGVRLIGELVCATPEQAAIVAEELPHHLELTRAEPGCLAFEVTPTADPLVWSVAEHFASERAFELHQQRVAASEWGRLTVGIERCYTVEGLSA